jgi:glycerol-3-phosphate dehydrogenase
MRRRLDAPLLQRSTAEEGFVRRNVAALAEKEYDVIIVGGGIFGICAAWDAVHRGLAVALVEQGDFAGATSANCFKIVHGGLRYLQHADLYRMRESNRELNALLRIAPHLVSPLPIAIPTYGHGMQSRGVLRLALRVYDLITCDRNRGLDDPQRRIPRPQVISRQECLNLFPGLKREGLTGAVIFYDGHMYSPPRLALSYLKSGIRAGGDAANYVEATDLLRRESRVYGIQARDVLSGNTLEIRGRIVLNAAGPWAEWLLRRQMGLDFSPTLSYSRDACFVVARPMIERYALAVQGRTRDPDAVLSRGHRHLFIVPWREHTLIGVWHVVYTGAPGAFTVTQEDLQAFLDEINEAYPPLSLTLNDVAMWHAGLVPFGHNESGAPDLSYGKRSHLIDHAREHRIEGLVSLIGVRYTTARGMATRAIDLVFRKLGRQAPRSVTATAPLYGGRIERFDEFLRSAIENRPLTLPPAVIRALVRNHGSAYKEVLRYFAEDPRWGETLGSSTVLKAEVIHAVREEMAQKLADVVFRRTDLGTGGYPGEVALMQCAELMASELGWGEDRSRQELDEANGTFPSRVCLDDRNAECQDQRTVLSLARDVARR